MIRSMLNDLTELRDRISICDERISALTQTMIDVSKRSVACRTEIFGEGSGVVYRKLLHDPPLAMRSEVGMIVNEQRSVLDALACALATRNGANNISDVYFPVTKSKEKFFKHGIKKIKKLSAPDRLKIENIKPWACTEESPDDGNMALFLLHEADRVRKHQNLLQWSCLGGVFPAGPGRIGMLNAGSVIFEKVGREEQLAFFQGVTCPLGVTVQLVYRDADLLRGKPVLGLLHDFNTQLTGVLNQF